MRFERLTYPIYIRQAEKPTEKAFRASYRASVHGALVHDASYFQYLELKGVEGDLKLLFNELCDPTAVSPASKRYFLFRFFFRSDR